MSLLLIHSRPVMVIPELAVAIGLHEAMLLQQVHYWKSETSSGVEVDGKRWIYNTMDEWRNQFPFLSESTIRRAFISLKNQGLLCIEQFNKHKHDRTNYYAINYEHPALTDTVKLTASIQSDCTDRGGQIDCIDTVKLTVSNRSNCTPRSGQIDRIEPVKLTCSLTETTTEITTEKNQKISSSQNSDESSDTPPNVDFLAKHPEAVVCTPKGTKWASQQDLDCAGWIFNRIQDLSQRLCASQPKQPNWTEWGNEIRLMREIDGHSHREICELFKRVNQDAFWCRNVLSPRKLREKWDDLTLKLSSPGGAAAKSGKAELDFNNTDWIYGIENELRNAGVGA